MIAVHVAARFPALYGDLRQVAAVDERLQIVVTEALAAAEIIGDPARLGHAERAHRAQGQRTPDLRGVECFGHLHADAVEHAFGQIVDALEVLAPQDHQFAERKPRLEPALFVLPAPPACRPFLFAFEVRRLHRAVVADVGEQPVHVRAIFTMHALRVPVGPMMIARVRAVPVQCVIRDRRETGFVRPAFEDIPGGKRMVEPLRRIGTESGEQHEVRAARDNVDRVDLHQLHALDRDKQTPACRACARRPQQPLCCEMQIAGLLYGEGGNCIHRVLDCHS